MILYSALYNDEKILCCKIKEGFYKRVTFEPTLIKEVQLSEFSMVKFGDLIEEKDLEFTDDSSSS